MHGGEALPLNWKEWWKRHEWTVTFRARAAQEVSGPAGAAGGTDDQGLEAFFLRCLEDSDRDVRAGAATALGKFGSCSPAVVEGLERAMGDRYDTVVQGATLALGMVRAVTAGPRIRRTLEDRRQELSHRVFAAVSLGYMGDPAHLACLQRIVTSSDEKSDVRAAAILALGLLGEERGAWTLLPLVLGNGNETYQAFAVSALARIGVRNLTARVGSREREVDLLDLFEKRLLDKTTPREARRALALALGSFGAQASTVEVLKRSYLNDRDEGVKGFALISLARLEKSAAAREDAGAFLCRAVRREGDAVVRGFATLAAALGGGSEAGPCLLEVFQRDGSADVRAAAALGLGLLKYGEALPLLGEEVKNPKTGGEARGYACVAVGLIGGREAVPYLKAIIEEVDVPYLKWAAATGLALMGDRSAIPDILRRMRDRNQVTRQAMVHSLQYFRDATTIRPLINHFIWEKSDPVRLLAVMTLGAVGDNSREVPVLRRLDRDVNWMAAEKVHALVHVLGLF